MKSGPHTHKCRWCGNIFDCAIITHCTREDTYTVQDKNFPDFPNARRIIHPTVICDLCEEERYRK